MYVLCQGYFNMERLFSFLICQVSVVAARIVVASEKSVVVRIRRAEKEVY